MNATFKNGFIFILTVFFSIVTISCSGTNEKQKEVIPLIPMDYWPNKDWRISTPERQGIDSSRLVKMMEYIDKKDKHIDSITIIRNGYLVADAYFYPYQKGYKHIIHSCTKSVISALVGIAIDKGYILSIDQPVIEFFPDRSFDNLDANKRAMTLKHLLTMTSGLECRDSYKYKWAGLIELTKSGDWTQHVLDLPMSHPPGEDYEYCNGVSFILSALIQKSTGMRTLDFAYQYLFGPLGIADVSWDASPQGIDVGWGKMWLKPHDMAKFGLLYLNKGRWNGKQIISESWVEASTQGHVRDGEVFDRYGFQWRIDDDGFYMAAGHAGQFIYIVPSKNMVVVFTSILGGMDFFFPYRLLKKYIIPSAVSSEPLPENPEKNAALSALMAKSAISNSADQVPAMPELAMKISGKIYTFDPNVIGLKTLTLFFRQNGSEAEIEWIQKDPRALLPDKDLRVLLSIGLDNVYRFTGDEENRWARKGGWKTGDTFIFYYQRVGFTLKGLATIKFENNKVLLRFDPFMGPPLKLTGYYPIK